MNDYKELIERLKNLCAMYRDEWYSEDKIIEEIVNIIEQLVKERDAAVKELKQFLDCDVCKNNNDECLNNGLCKKCSVGKSTRKHWEWRGVQE